jgi:hypothetical protein
MKILRPMTVNDAALDASNVAEADYAAYNAGTTYASGDRVIVVSTNVHLVYESVQNSNTGHTPATSPTWWLEIGPTNRWKMFDALVNTQTSNADSIEVTITADGRIDSVAFLNVSAASIQVTMTDATDGVVYDETQSMISDSGITDWYAYFFEPIERASEAVFTDLPPYADATIEITIADAGQTVLCGVCVLALSKDIGLTGMGAAVGIQDYSVKTQDDFGNYTILERAFARRASFTVSVESSYTDALHRLLAAYRATPVVYIGEDEFRSTIVYGFYRDFNVEIAYAERSICTIEIEGLT